MPVEIEHVPERTETTQLIVGEPSDEDAVLETVEDEYYKVEREVTVTHEQYVVRTWDAYDEKTTYWVSQTDDGSDWYVSTKEVGSTVIHRSSHVAAEKPTLSTKAVRRALREREGVTLLN